MSSRSSPKFKIAGQHFYVVEEFKNLYVIIKKVEEFTEIRSIIAAGYALSLADASQKSLLQVPRSVPKKDL